MIIIFDLDGTVLDTYSLIRQNFVDVFAKCLPNYQYTEKEIESYFGPSLFDTFSKIVDEKETINYLFKEYRRISDLNTKKYTKLFPGTVEALEKFKNYGYKLAILSNKVHDAIVLGLKTMKIYDYFSMIIGLDDLEKPKPDPEGVQKIMTSLNDDKAVMIGDSEIDIKTAQNAKILSIGCTWAINKREVFEKANADKIIDNYMEFVKMMEDYNV